MVYLAFYNIVLVMSDIAIESQTNTPEPAVAYFIVTSEQGIHMTPVSLMSQIATQHDIVISVSNESGKGRYADVTSMFDMMFEVMPNSTNARIAVKFSTDDFRDALAALSRLEFWQIESQL